MEGILENSIPADSAPMESVINEPQPDIPLVLRSKVVKLCAMSAFDREEDIFSKDIPNAARSSWENEINNNSFGDIENGIIQGQKAAIEKFCELEGIKQEFKGDKYRLIGVWRKP